MLDLVTITALGHLITGLSAVVLLPFTIGYVGFVGRVQKSLEFTDPENKELGKISGVQTQKNSVRKNTSQESDPDVELLD